MRCRFFRRAGALLLALALALSLVPAALAADYDGPESGMVLSYGGTEHDGDITCAVNDTVEAGISHPAGASLTGWEFAAVWTVTANPADAVESSAINTGGNIVANGATGINIVCKGAGEITVQAEIYAKRAGSTDPGDLYTRETVTHKITVNASTPNPPNPPGAVTVTGVTLDETSLTMAPGDRKTLVATAALSDGTSVTGVANAQKFKWETTAGSSPDITVNTGGYIRVSSDAANGATATVQVSYKDDKGSPVKTAQCTITVEAPAVTGVTMSETAVGVEVGKQKTLVATAALSKGKDETSDKNAGKFTWSSSSTSVTVSDRGLVSVARDAVVGSKATITATYTDALGNEESAACEVTVLAASIKPVTSIGIAGDAERTVVLGSTLTLTARVVPSTATAPIAWSIAGTDTSVVTMTPSADGRTCAVAGVKAGGPVSISVTGSGRTATVSVTVIDPVQEPILISPSRGTGVIDPGKDVTLTAATGTKVTWTSKNPDIATVGRDTGVVTGVKPGVATITATGADGSTGEYQVTVSGLVLDKTSLALLVGYSDSIAYQAYGAAATGNASAKWETNPESIATVSSGGRVTGMAPGTTVATASKGKYRAECRITVEEDVADAIDRSINAGEKLEFSGLASDLNSRCREKTKVNLDYITNLQVATDEGVVFYRYGSPEAPNHGVGGVEEYYVTASANSGRRGISELTFVPAGDFTGTAVIEYTGCNTDGRTFHGTVRVLVRSSGDVVFSTAMNSPLNLTAKEFKDICKVKTNRSASYITFTQPSGGKGTLYYNYTPEQWSQKVDGSTKYYLDSTPSLEKVTFVPAENFTGTVTVPYRCTDTTGSSYSGTMTVNVEAGGGESSGGVEYTTGINQRVTLAASDFSAASQELSGRSLSYIFFDELPPVSQGVLYYNYTSSASSRVDTATRYNRSNTDARISSITFVPASNFSGTVTVPYTGYDSAGQSYKDNLVIHVTDAAGTVYYTTDQGEAVTFRGEDFNEACQRANSASLNYVVFTLPSSSVGALYRNYRSSSNPGTRISSYQQYYRGGNPSISDVTFVPRDRYEGTVTIPFTGRDAGGAEFKGTVSITVGQEGGRVVRYSTASGGVVRFSAGDFNAASRSATGSDLSYLSFEPPASRYGTLYYQYNANRGTGTQVTSSSSYYRTGGSRQLDDVSFAAANINGTASFQYTARSANGERFTGTVEVAIGNAGSSGYSNGTRYTGSSTPIALRTEDFQSACQAAAGGTLSYIRFTSLPDESAGQLCMGYESPSRPGVPASTTLNYTASSGLSIGQLSFVPKAEYQGQVNIPYTGYNTQGGSFSGTVVLDLSAGYCSTPFYDVDSGWDWAKPSVEFLRYAGVTNGYSDGSFRPSRSISRGEFTLMVCRAFGFDTSGKVSSFPDVAAGSPYAGAVATAKNMGIVEGSGGAFRPNSPITRQSAMTIICRAMKAAGERVPPTVSTYLNRYSDQAQIAPHARESVASLVQMGVVKGNSSMQINPTRSISRAEMAVILHRVLTLS